MRFKCKEKIKQNSPKIGDTRGIRRFLLVPRKIGNVIVWLEFVNVIQCYQAEYDGFEYVDSVGWVTTSYELIEPEEHMEYL
jgi:hypothetical protein